MGTVEHGGCVLNVYSHFLAPHAEGLMKQIAAGKMSLRIFRQQTSQLASMGPMSQVVGMIPGLSQLASMGSAGNDQTAAKKFKQYSIIMDSMTDYELDLDLSDIKARGAAWHLSPQHGFPQHVSPQHVSPCGRDIPAMCQQSFFRRFNSAELSLSRPRRSSARHPACAASPGVRG